MAVCVAVIDKDSSPLLLECADSVLQPDNSAITDSYRRSAQLKLHYMVHSSLDIADEKLSQSTGGTSGGRTTDMRELYLGMLYSNEEYKAYGYATNTKVKFILVTELGNTALKDQEMRAVFKRLHAVYCDAVASPFYVPGRPLQYKALQNTVKEILSKV